MLLSNVFLALGLVFLTDALMVKSFKENRDLIANKQPSVNIININSSTKKILSIFNWKDLNIFSNSIILFRKMSNQPPSWKWDFIWNIFNFFFLNRFQSNRKMHRNQKENHNNAKAVNRRNSKAIGRRSIIDSVWCWEINW